MAGARGSEWHRWDPYLHAPGTLQADEYPAADGWEHYLQALESASPVIRAIGVTSCVTRSYELAKAAKEQGRLEDCAAALSEGELEIAKHLRLIQDSWPQRLEGLEAVAQFVRRKPFAEML